MKLRKEIELAEMPEIECTDESYADAIKYLAKFFLQELDKKEQDWKPQSDSAYELGKELWEVCKEIIPQKFREELSGGQVEMAAWLAYRAFKNE